MTEPVCSHCYEVLRTVTIIKTENRMVVARDSGEGRIGKFLFIWYKCADLQDEKNDGDGRWQWPHSHVNVFNTTDPHA